jgi:protein-S-isoprenylcysteine O-methyltransferase Ste14
MSIEAVRYWIAVLVLVSAPPAVLYWVAIHPFFAFWRRRGKALTFTVAFTGYLAIALVLFLAREPLLAVRGPWSPWLAVAGGALYLLAAALETRTRRKLRWKVLVGVHEIDPQTPGPGLLVDGIYARTRNPRYLTFMIGLFGFALMTNYLAIWVIALLAWPAMRLIVHWEERELRDRFGAEYLEYCRRVPRFVPRFGRPAG